MNQRVLSPLERAHADGRFAACWSWMIPRDSTILRHARWFPADHKRCADACRADGTSRERTWTYRFTDVDEHNLYVGIASNLHRRMKQHEATKVWWDSVYRLTANLHCCRAHAVRAEEYTIRCLRPLQNIVHNDGVIPRFEWLSTSLAEIFLATDGCVWAPEPW